jgi:ABC-type sugar transport system substrate-binding protein
MTNAPSLRAGGSRTDKPRRSLGRLTVLGVAAAMALAACGSGDSGSDTASGAAVDVATYQQGAEKAMAPVSKFTGPTEGPKAQAGKKVMFLACGFEAEGCNLPAKAAEEAGDALGWDMTLVDGKFDPRIFSRAIQEAIDDKVDGIIIDAISVEAIAEPIKRARAAGIVVGSYDSANTPSKDGVSYEVIADPKAQGKAMSDYMIWKTEGKARPFLLDAPEFKGPSTWLNAAGKGFEDCSSCKVVDRQNFVAGDAATRLPQLSLSTARQNPDMNVLVASYDAAMLQTIPSLEQAGLLKNIKVGTFNGVSPALQFVRDGKLSATVGGAMAWGAWAAMDNMNRVLAGQEAVEQNVPIRLITAENIDSIAPGGPWDGDVDFRAAYKTIWGR